MVNKGEAGGRPGRPGAAAAALLRWGMAAAVPLAMGATLAMAAESMHSGIDKYEGSKTCLECHDTLGKEVAESLHYRVSGEAQNLVGDGKGKPAGMLAGSCQPGLTATAANWLTLIQPKESGKEPVAAGCALCHAGMGTKPNPADKLGEEDYNNIDCLVCHGPDYKRTVVKDSLKGKIAGKEYSGYRLVPAPGVDPLKAARGARKPTPEMCLRCHTGTGGGPNYKHGAVPTADTDVHFSMGMNCTECHTVKKHKIAGGADLRHQELLDVRVTCTNCHDPGPHKGNSDKEKETAAILNRHAERLACQTCHIPAIARDQAMPTLVERDWTKPQRDPQSGLFTPASKLATNVRPEYFWWNRSVRENGEPVGARNASGSRIHPWKRMTQTVIADEASGLPLNLNAATYAQTGDPAAAARQGAKDAGKPFSGKWKAEQVNLYFSVNHQVAPKGEALKCGNCHSPDGVIDFKALKRQRP